MKNTVYKPKASKHPRLHISWVIEDILKKISANNYLLKDHINFDHISKVFSQETKYSVKLFKTPKWSDDAIIIKVNLTGDNTFTLGLKIHEDKYPLASNIYDNKKSLTKISNSGLTTYIFKTSVIKSMNKQYRLVFYEFMNGSSMGKLVKEAGSKEIRVYRKLLKSCVSGLLKCGFNVFVRDLDDFLVIMNNNKLMVIVTDHNAIMDCSSANEYSRARVVDIINKIIDELVVQEYKPFVSKRPTMVETSDESIDLRF